MIINGKKYDIAVPATEKEKRIGYSQSSSIGKLEGMLFKNVNTITMKDTSFPLKLVYLDKDYNVVEIIDAAPFTTKLYKVSNASHTLELHPEATIAVGDSIKQKDYVFDYNDKFKGKAIKHTLKGYEVEDGKLVKKEGGVIKGNLIEINDLLSPYKTEELEEGIYAVSLEGMELLDDKGYVQMTLDGGERIFSIKNTKELIKLTEKLEQPEDYIKLGKRIIELLDERDNREPEYV